MDIIIITQLGEFPYLDMVVNEEVFNQIKNALCETFPNIIWNDITVTEKGFQTKSDNIENPHPHNLINDAINKINVPKDFDIEWDKPLILTKG